MNYLFNLLLEVVTKKNSTKQAIKSTVQNTVRKQVGGSKTNEMRKLKTSENQAIRKKKPATRNRSNFVSKFQNDCCPQRQHTIPDLFEKQPLLVNFDNDFTPKTGISYSPYCPLLEFEVFGDSIDLQKLLLEIKCKISRNNDGDLRTGTDAANTDVTYLSNNALYFFFRMHCIC